VQPCCLAVGISWADSSTDSGGVAGSVDVAKRNHRGQVAEGVVGAGGSRDTGGVLSGRPLANMVGKLALVSDLGGPPLGSSRGSRDESGDVARGDGEGGLPLAHVVGELPLVGNLGGPPLGGGSRSRDKSGDVARGDRHSGLTSAERNQRQRRNLAEHVETKGRRFTRRNFRFKTPRFHFRGMHRRQMLRHDIQRILQVPEVPPDG